MLLGLLLFNNEFSGQKLLLLFLESLISLLIVELEFGIELVNLRV